MLDIGLGEIGKLVIGPHTVWVLFCRLPGAKVVSRWGLVVLSTKSQAGGCADQALDHWITSPGFTVVLKINV